MMGVSLGKAKCTKKYPSGKAIEVFLEEDKKWKTIPTSVIHDDSEVWKEGQRGDLVVKTWWAERNNLT